MSTQEHKICQDYLKNNTTIKDLVLKYNLTKKQILKILNKNNKTKPVKRKVYKPKFSKDFLKKEYIDNQKSFRTIAQENKCAPLTVKKSCEYHNIKSRPTSIKGRKVKSVARKDITGQIFGNLTVVNHVKGGWLCRCKCGKEKVYRASRLNQGVKTCGCRMGGKGPNSSHWKGYKNIPKTV